MATMKKASGKGIGSLARGMMGSSPRTRRGSVDSKLVGHSLPVSLPPCLSVSLPASVRLSRERAVSRSQPMNPHGVSELDRNVLLAEPAAMWFSAIGELQGQVRATAPLSLPPPLSVALPRGSL